MAYTPSVPAGITTLEDVVEYLRRELERLASEGSETTVIELRPIYAPPAKPREGMIVSADGTSWNPGAGAGAYERKGGAWVKL